MHAESEEADVEQRVILASFETRHHDQLAQEFMATERRAAVARLADEHAAARTDAHRRNIEAARAAMSAAEQRLAQADVALATVVAGRQQREHQYPLPSFNASSQRQEERHTFTSFLEDAERRRRECVSEESLRRRRMVSRPPRRSDDGAGAWAVQCSTATTIGRIGSRRRRQGF
jgi:hypothetical protein